MELIAKNVIHQLLIVHCSSFQKMEVSLWGNIWTSFERESILNALYPTSSLVQPLSVCQSVFKYFGNLSCNFLHELWIPSEYKSDRARYLMEFNGAGNGRYPMLSLRCFRLYIQKSAVQFLDSLYLRKIQDHQPPHKNQFFGPRFIRRGPI